MIPKVYNTLNNIAIFFVIFFVVWVILTLLAKILEYKSRITIVEVPEDEPAPEPERYDVEITDKFVSAEVSNLLGLQDVYNAQISQIRKKVKALYAEIDESDPICRVTDATKERVMAEIFKQEEKMYKIIKKSDDITAKVYKIAIEEYKRQHR